MPSPPPNAHPAGACCAQGAGNQGQRPLRGALVCLIPIDMIDAGVELFAAALAGALASRLLEICGDVMRFVGPPALPHLPHHHRQQHQQHHQGHCNEQLGAAKTPPPSPQQPLPLKPPQGTAACPHTARTSKADTLGARSYSPHICAVRCPPPAVHPSAHEVPEPSSAELLMFPLPETLDEYEEVLRLSGEKPAPPHDDGRLSFDKEALPEPGSSVALHRGMLAAQLQQGGGSTPQAAAGVQPEGGRLSALKGQAHGMCCGGGAEWQPCRLRFE